MNSSVQKELEEIERSQRISKPSNNGPRRGSSIFAAMEDNDAVGPYGRPSYLTQPGDLLEDFPSDSNHDMDYYPDLDDGDDGVIMGGKMSGGWSTGSASTSSTTNYSGTTEKSSGRLGEAARMQQLANSQDLPGGINHRPLVGGFAAAAYEAARAHHYSMQNDERNMNIPKDRRPPPCI